MINTKSHNYVVYKDDELIDILMSITLDKKKEYELNHPEYTLRKELIDDYLLEDPNDHEW